ncbi:LysR family transcriptional regulator, partial [Burkholderia sp. 4M9327G5]
MNIPLLETFRAVVQEGSALRAAERLGCTQSNVTARLRQLEASLDAPLFDRHGKRLVLNDAGRRLIPYCDRILRLVDEATQVVREAPVARNFRL